MDENQLREHIHKAIDGEQRSLAALFNEYKNPVYCFLTNYIDNQSDIEDVVQETFINAFGSLNTLVNPLKFRNWIFTIAYRRAMDFYRARKPSKTLKVVEDESALESLEKDNAEFIPSEIMETEETRQYIADLVKRLPEEQKTTVLFYYYQQMSVSEIAEAMECSAGTVKSRLNYARKFIKEEIAKQTKKGYKVIAVVPLPLLTQILLWQAEQKKLTASASGNIWNGVESSLNITPQTTAGTGVVPKAATSGIKIAGVTVTAKLAAMAAGVLAIIATAVVIVVSHPKEDVEIFPIVNNVVENSLTSDGANESNSKETEADSQLAAINFSDLGVIEIKSKSDYAKMYYDMIQKVYIHDEGFLDAEIAYNYYGEEGYSLELIYKEGVGYKFYYATIDANTNTYDFSAIPDKILNETNRLNYSGNLTCAMIVRDFDRDMVLMEWSDGTGHVCLEWSAVNKYGDSRSYIDYSLGMYGHEESYYGGSTRQISGQEFAQIIVPEELKTKSIGTWGFGHGETDFTKGERLKAYFE